MPFSKKTITRFVIILIVLVLLPFAVQLILQSYLTSSLYNVEQELEKATNHAYRFKFSKVKVNIFRSYVHIIEFTVSAHDNVTDKSVFKTGDLKVKGIGLISLFLHHKITVDQVLVDGAEISIRPGENNPGNETAGFINPYEMIKNQFQSIFVKKIQIENTYISYYQDPNDSLPSLVSEKSSVILENLLIDSVTTYTYKRWFDADKFLVLSKEFKYITKDSLYTFRFSQIAISYRDSTIEIDSVKMLPNYSEKEFAHKYGEQTDRIHAESVNIMLNGVNVKSLFEKRKIIASSVKISHLQVTAFRDKNIPRVEKRISTVQELIKKIPVYIKIDSINISNSKITYKEIAPGSKTAGIVFFSNLSGTIYNLTNDSLLKQHVLHITAKAKLMGHGEMTATINFPYLKNGSFSMQGHLGEMDMKELNQVLEKNAMVSISDGTIKDADFTFEAGLKSSKGIMTFKYNNLHVRMLNQETQESKAIRERVSSILANSLIIINDNPPVGKSLKKADLFYVRNPNRFIFNYSWKTILSGIKETIGLNAVKSKNKKQKK